LVKKAPGLKLASLNGLYTGERFQGHHGPLVENPPPYFYRGRGNIYIEKEENIQQVFMPKTKNKAGEISMSNNSKIKKARVMVLVHYTALLLNDSAPDRK
jgi:hypothetical protein